MMDIRDRVKELKRLKAGDLVPHPLNPRRHPLRQHAAVDAFLQRIGIADRLLGRALPDGRVQLLDAHGSPLPAVHALLTSTRELRNPFWLVATDGTAQAIQRNSHTVDPTLTSLIRQHSRNRLIQHYPQVVPNG